MSDQTDVETYVSEKRSVKTIQGSDFDDLSPGEDMKIGEGGRMVWVRARPYGDDGDEWHMIPFSNVDRIKDYRVPADPEELERDEAEAVEEEEEEGEPFTEEFFLDQTISELEEWMDVVYDEELLNALIEEDDRKGATELYEQRLEELQE